MKTPKIKKLTIKLLLLLSFLAFVKSDESWYDDIQGDYQRETLVDGIPIIFGLEEVLSYRQIHVYYADNQLIVSQRGTPREQPKLDPDAEKQDLKIIVPDNERVVLNPPDINPEKEIYAYHNDGWIYVYQGDEPKLPLQYTDDDSPLYLKEEFFNLGLLIKIYYQGNRLYVSQYDVPDNYSSDETPGSYLQYIGSDRTVVYLYPTKIDWSEDVVVQHKGNSIYVYQGRKPGADLREEYSETKYLPEDSPHDFDATFDSEEILKVDTNTFNPKKTALIFFVNGKMNITQIGAPEETDPTLLSHVKSLQTITSDENILLFHPARFSSKYEIKMQHKGNRIFVWTGSKRAPTFNINKPEIIEVIRPEIEPPQEYDAAVESEEILTVYSDDFDLNKLVWIFFEDGKLKVTQVGAPEETDPTLLTRVKSLQTITSDENKVLFHPARFSSNYEIKMQHKGNRIFVWTGSDRAPAFSINKPEMIEVVKPEIDDLPNPKSEFNAAFKTGKTIKLSSREFDLEKLVSIFFEDNQLKVTQVDVPEETRKNTKYKYGNLRVISPDVNKLLLHPARIQEDQEINLRHENGKIYVWQGSDQIPTKNINRPDIVKVIQPDTVIQPKRPEPAGALTAYSGDTLIIPPGTFDVKKLISVFYRDNRLEITQKDRIKESDVILEQKLPISVHEQEPLTFSSDIFNLSANIYIRHNDDRINIWQESDDLPEATVDIPDVKIDRKPEVVVEQVNSTLIKPELPLLNSTVVNIKTAQHNDTQLKIQADPSNILNMRIPESNYTVNISSWNFDPKKLVSISRKTNYWNITQIGTPDETLNRTLNYTYLQIVRPSTETLLLHTAFVNPSLMHLRYKDGKIYLWQGNNQPKIDVKTEIVDSVSSVPKPEHKLVINDTSTQPKAEKKTGPKVIEIAKPKVWDTEMIDLNQLFNVTYESGHTVKISSNKFNPKKVVSVSFKNNKFYVTQIGTPDEVSNLPSNNTTLQVVEPDSATLFIHAAHIDPKLEMNIRHENGKIYIWQGGNQPKINVETQIVERVSRSPTTVKPEITFNQTIASARTLTMSSEQFGHHRMVIISYKDNVLRVTQDNAPAEIWERRSEYTKNLQIIKPDNETLLLHAALTNLDLPINFRHENGKIYIWQGTQPTIDVHSDILHVVDPHPKEIVRSERVETAVPDFDSAYESSSTGKVSSRRYNLRKLVSVTVKDNKLHVSQVNTPAESAIATGSYKNLQIIKPDTVTMLLHLALVNPNLVINFRHENGKIYIWQGSDKLPEVDIEMPDVVEVVGPRPSEKKQEIIVQDLNQSIPDTKSLDLRSNMYNPNKLIVVKHENGMINLSQMERVDDGIKNSGYEDVHLAIPDGSDVKIDPRKIDPDTVINIKYRNHKVRIHTEEM